MMDLHPNDKIIFVHDRETLAAEVIACFSNPDGVEGDWFNARTGTFGTAFRVRDEGVTWSRDTSDAGRESLLAAFMLEQSA